jgi:hypothetical protein
MIKSSHKKGYWFENIAPLGEKPFWVEVVAPMKESDKLFGYEKDEFMRKQYK